MGTRRLTAPMKRRAARPWSSRPPRARRWTALETHNAVPLLSATSSSLPWALFSPRRCCKVHVFFLLSPYFSQFLISQFASCILIFLRFVFISSDYPLYVVTQK